MQRRVLLLLILTWAGFFLLFNGEVAAELVETNNDLKFLEPGGCNDEIGAGTSRKLLQDKLKTKAAKSGKAKAKETDGLPEAKVNGVVKDVSEGKISKLKSLESADGSRKDGAASKKPASIKKPGKDQRVLDEEEDEDIKFMEEEAVAAKGEPKEEDKNVVAESVWDKKTESSSGKKIKKKNGETNEDSTMDAAGKEDEDAVKFDIAGKDTEDSTADTIAIEDIEDETKDDITDATKAEPGSVKSKTSLAKEAGESLPIEKTKEEVTEDDGGEVRKEKPQVKKKKKSNKKKKTGKENVGKQVEEASLDAQDIEVIPDDFDEVSDQKEKVKEEKIQETVPETQTRKSSATSDPGRTKASHQPMKQKVDKPIAKIKPVAGAPKTNTTKKSDGKKATGAAKKDEPLKQKEAKPKKDQVPVVNFPQGASEDEDLQTDAGLSKAGADSDADLDDDLDNFMDQMSTLPTKIQETAGNVADTIRPGLKKITEKSKTYFSTANQQMTQTFTPIMGEQVAPVVASLISYALLLIPLIVVLYMLERIRANLSLAKVLFFINVYLAAYFVTLVLATFALHAEPMAFFFRNSRSSCVFLQLLQALGYLLYIVLYTAVLAKSCSNGGVLEKLASGFQWVIVALFGLHYYVTVFHRAMAMKLPKTNWKVYLVYSSAFAVLALFARAKIEQSKKEYYYSPVDESDEAVPVDKRS